MTTSSFLIPFFRLARTSLHLLSFVFFCAWLVLRVPAIAFGAPEESKTNIIVIMADDLGLEIQPLVGMATLRLARSKSVLINVFCYQPLMTA